MKQLVITISTIFMLAMVSLSTTATANNGTLSSEESTVTSQTEEEALYCSVEDSNGNEVSCWFCNCRKLAEEVLD